MRFKLAPLLVVLLVSASFAAEDDEVVVGPITPNPQEQLQQFGMPNFDQMLFQNDGNPTLGEQRMRARTELQLAELDQVCQLNDAQKQKLQLAVRGDMQRFMSDAAVLRLRYEKLMKDQQANDPNAFNVVWQQMWQELRPLQQRMAAGLTSAPTSLLIKVIPKTLTSEQQREYEAVAAERRRFRYEASIGVSLHQLEEAVALTEKQREELTTLLLAMPAPRHTGQYETYVILCRLEMMPNEKLEPLFTADQWKSLRLTLDQYRNVRQSWIEAGILDAEDFPPATQE
jgi:hypothetical protein